MEPDLNPFPIQAYSRMGNKILPGVLHLDKNLDIFSLTAHSDFGGKLLEIRLGYLFFRTSLIFGEQPATYMHFKSFRDAFALKLRPPFGHKIVALVQVLGITV